jgi:VWFA-related protein
MRWLSAVLLACVVCRAQDQPDVTFSTEVKVVNLLATVLNKGGGIVRDLTKDDFVLAENGRPQTIRYFSRETDLPLTIGLMVDTSMSQQRVMDAERGASFRFLEQVLRPEKDHVFIMQFDMSVHLTQALTSSFRQLGEALAFVDTPDRRTLQTQSTGAGTVLYDAVIAASKDVMAAQRGRKALILLTDGDDNGSDATLAAAIDAAQRADTLVYSILYADKRFGGRDGRPILMRLSRETGGRFLEVSKKLSVEQTFDLIQEELRSQYNMGFVSDQPVRISEFRKLQLTVRQKDLIVQTRDKYWAKR